MGCSSMTIRDFSLDLAIHRHDGSYLLEISHHDPSSQAVVAPLRGPANFELDELLAVEAVPADYGRTLSRQLFSDPRLAQRFRLVETAAQLRGVALRMSLRIDPSAKELQALRWELLAHPESGERLTTSETVLLSRFMVSHDWRPIRLRAKADLRALVVVSAPEPAKLARLQLAPVDFVVEARNARRGLAGIAIDVLGGPAYPVTVDAMLDALRPGVDILYLVSHGMFARSSGTAGLVLQDEFGEAQIVKAEEFTRRVAELEHLPRLVVLASCQSAGDGNQFGSNERTTVQATLAAQLADAGVPAVLAMQGHITMATVEAMMPTMFKELLRDGRIDRALAVARGKVRDRHDAWMPALFTRLSDGRLWLDEPARKVVEREPERTSELSHASHTSTSMRLDDRIDFSLERGRHALFFGREDVLREARRLVSGAAFERSWILLEGGPGMGKSALISQILDELEASEGCVTAHHFIRKGVEDWDSPARIVQSLVAQVTAAFPGQEVSGDLTPVLRLTRLLTRISRQVLVPRGQRLVLVLDGLDEATVATKDNPLPAFLPHALPPNVFMLCSSRPIYPHLHWLETRDPFVRIDLGDARWAASNVGAVRGYWEHVGPLMTPPLSPSQIADAVEAADGNLLHAVKLFQWLSSQPPDQRNTAVLPRGLAAFMEQIWQQLRTDPGYELACEGLSLLGVAREGLPRDELAKVAGWSSEQTEQFLAITRPFLLAQQNPWGPGESYRTFHRSFAELIADKLGAEVIVARHRRFAETIASWPAAADASAFRHYYTNRHALTHRLEGKDWAGAFALATNLAYLSTQLRELGTSMLESELERVVHGAPKPIQQTQVGAILRAIRAESHWLALHPDALPFMLYNRLRSEPWPKRIIERVLGAIDDAGGLLLRHPVSFGGVDRTFAGHSAGVTCCAISSDGRMLLSGSFDRSVRTWDLESGRAFSSMERHRKPVTTCAFSPDGSFAVSGSHDRTLKLWQVSTSSLLHSVHAHESWVRKVVFSDSGRFILSGCDGELKLWSSEDLSLVRSYPIPDGRLATCGFGRGDRIVVAVFESGLSIVLARESGETLAQTQHAALTACAFDGASERLLAGSEDGRLRLYGIRAQTPVIEIEAHQGPITACAFAADQKRMLSVAADGIRAWNLLTGTRELGLRGHQAATHDIAVAPGGALAVTASSDMTLRLWDLNAGGEQQANQGHSAAIVLLTPGSEDAQLLSVGADGLVLAWDTVTGEHRALQLGSTAPITMAVASRTRLCLARDDGTVEVVDKASGQATQTWAGPAVVALALDEERCSFVRAEESSVAISALCMSAFGLVVAREDGELELWSFAEEAPLHLQGHSAVVDALALSPDGRRLVSGSHDRSLRVWDLEQGRCLATLRSPTAPVIQCLWTPVGTVVSATVTGSIIVWDVETWTVRHEFSAHVEPVSGLSYLSTGEICSISEDRTLKLWDPTRGACSRITLAAAPMLATCQVGELLCAGDQYGNVWMLELGEERRLPTAEESQPQAPAIPVFLVWHEDDAKVGRALHELLEQHLSAGRVRELRTRVLEGSGSTGDELDVGVEQAALILVVVSPSFLQADYCWDAELSRALEREAAGQVRMRTVLAENCAWSRSPLAKLGAPVPRDALVAVIGELLQSDIQRETRR
jgi:WD40 repeat protein